MMPALKTKKSMRGSLLTASENFHIALNHLGLTLLQLREDFCRLVHHTIHQSLDRLALLDQPLLLRAGSKAYLRHFT